MMGVQGRKPQKEELSTRKAGFEMEAEGCEVTHRGGWMALCLPMQGELSECTGRGKGVQENKDGRSRGGAAVSG
jgi:hypothetical protein